MLYKHGYLFLIDIENVLGRFEILQLLDDLGCKNT